MMRGRDKTGTRYAYIMRALRGHFGDKSGTLGDKKAPFPGLLLVTAIAESLEIWGG